MPGHVTAPLRHLCRKFCQLLQLPQPALQPAAVGLMTPSVSLAGPDRTGALALQHKTDQLAAEARKPTPACLAVEEPEPLLLSEAEPPTLSEAEPPTLSEAEVPALSEAEVIEMKKICASNGEFWRLRMIEAYEQAMASIQFMYLNPQARIQMESRLLQDLLAELGEYAEA